jgi:hypothetical protein
MTKTLSALALVAGMMVSGVALADPPSGTPAKPVATSANPKHHGPRLKEAPKKGGAEAQPGADKVAAPVAEPKK